MKIEKSNLTVQGDHLSFAVPFEKVNKEKREVSGWATLNNIDSQDDIVTTEASLAAFEEARGNIREMHQPKAVGRLVDFKLDTLFDQDGTRYEGIYVTAYVSKGSQDTWEKVLDGTLSGFSIGGNITDSETQFVKDMNGGQAVRFVKAYDLIELSLVDNPANQLANFAGISKSIFTLSTSDDGTTLVKGMVADVKMTNAFLCREEVISRVSDTETLKCVTCGNDMEYMGWIETAGDVSKAMTSLMNKFLNTEHNEGGVVKMSNDESKTVDSPEGDLGIVDPEVVEAPTSEDVVEETNEDDNAEEAVEAVGENTDEPDFEKMADDIKADSDAKIAGLEAKIEELQKSTNSKMDELGSQFTEAMQKFDSAKSEIDSVTKRLSVVEGKSAIRKSADVESQNSESSEPANEWTGAFFDRDLN